MRLKVGDIVWAYSEEQYCVMSYEIIHIDKYGYYDANSTDVPNDDMDDGLLFTDEDIGDFVFLSEKECADVFCSDDDSIDYTIDEWREKVLHVV